MGQVADLGLKETAQPLSSRSLEGYIACRMPSGPPFRFHHVLLGWNALCVVSCGQVTCIWSSYLAFGLPDDVTDYISYRLK